MKGWANKIRATVAVLAAATLAASLVPAVALAHAVQPEARSATTNEASTGSWDEYFDAVDEAEAALLGTEWVSAPGEVTNATSFWIWLDAKIEALGLNKVRIRIDESSLEWVAPIDGTAADPAGTDGYFSVKISVYRSWLDALVARRVPINGVLKATPYEPGEEPVEPIEPSEPSEPEKPVQPEQPTDPDEGDGDQEQPTDPGSDPVTPPADDKPDKPGTPGPTGPTDTDPAPYVPADEEEAAQIMKELILQQKAADAGAWTLGSSDDEAHNEMFADEASAKKAVLASVRTMLEEKGIVPAGYTYQLGDPEVMLPTEEAEGSYKCPVYLTKVESAEGDAVGDEPRTSTEEAVLEARGLTMHPLHATQAAGNVRASTGSIVTYPIDERPDLVIDGLISRLKPQNVNRPVQVVPGDGNSGAGQPSSHPLANGQTAGSIKDANDDNDDDGSDDTEREIKRPQQLSDDKRNTPDVKTTVKSGSSIASTHDPMMGSPALLGSIGAIAAVVAVVCLLLVRRRQS